MKMVKSLLLGTAAGFVAVAGAQAADMPVKAAVQYVKICNLYGDGFYYIPGTNICLKLGGYVRAQFYGYYGGSSATATPFFGGNINNDRGPFTLNGGAGAGWSDFTGRTRAVITVDTREQTDYGVLRTYFLIGHTGDWPNAEGLYANRGFIQWAGFTFGLAQSFFDFYSAPATSYFATNTEDTGDGGWRVAAFTANFGNGITSTLSLEEPRRLGIVNAAFAGQVNGNFNPNGPNIREQFNNPFIVGAVASNDQGNIKAPDLVYNTRLDQQWGAIMLGGAVTDVTAAYYGANATSAATGLTSCAPPGFNAVTTAATGTGVPGGGSPVGSVPMRASLRQARMGGHRRPPPQRARRQLLPDAGQLHPRRAALHQPHPVADRQRRPLRGRQLARRRPDHGRHLRPERRARADQRLGHLCLLGAGVEPEVEDLHLRRLDLGDATTTTPRR